jgi:hypothetical protein
MSEANTSAPAETGELDMSAAADLVPDDAFELPEDSDEEHPEGAAEPAAEEAPTEEEPEGEEPAAPTEEEPPAEPEQPESTAEGPQTVVIDGKAIPLQEVQNGYLRQADYTRKTQEVAAERQALQAERTTVTNDRQQLASILDLATDIVKAHLPPEPDPALIDTDVVGYMQQDRAYKAAMAELTKLADARKTADAGSSKEQVAATEQAETARREALATEYRQLQTKVPELRTPEGHKAFFAKAEAAGAHYGLSPQDVQGIQDHRALLVLADAARLARSDGSKPTHAVALEQVGPAATSTPSRSSTRACCRKATDPLTESA